MKPRIVTSPARRKLGMIACGLALLTAGCASSVSTSPPSAPASGTAASATAAPSNSVLCANAAALRASLDKLRHVSVGTGAVNQITADLNDVKTALTTLVNDGHGQFQAQTSALSSALSKLKTSVSDLAMHPGASTVSGVVTALGGVSTAGQNLLAAMNTDCPSTSPASSA
jgi:hypothetical protein